MLGTIEDVLALSTAHHAMPLLELFADNAKTCVTGRALGGQHDGAGGVDAVDLGCKDSAKAPAKHTQPSSSAQQLSVM